MFEWHKAEPEPPALDAAYVARLGQLLGGPALHELLADGLIELADRLARLGELAVEGDREGIARLGHDLVGMAGHLGLAALSAAAAEINRAARGDGAAGPPGAAVERVRRIGAEAERALRDHLGAG